MDIAAKHVVRLLEDRDRVVGEQDLRLRALLLDQLAVVAHIIDAGERVLRLAERADEFLLVQHVGIRVHALIKQQVLVEQVVALLVRRVGQQHHDLLCAARDAAQADRKAVSRHDREHDADRIAELLAHVRGDVVHRAVVAVRACDDRFGHRDHVAIVQGKPVALCGLRDRVRNDLNHIVAFAHDRCLDAS